MSSDITPANIVNGRRRQISNDSNQILSEMDTRRELPSNEPTSYNMECVTNESVNLNVPKICDGLMDDVDFYEMLDSKDSFCSLLFKQVINKLEGISIAEQILRTLSKEVRNKIVLTAFIGGPSRQIWEIYYNNARLQVGGVFELNGRKVTWGSIQKHVSKLILLRLREFSDAEASCLKGIHTRWGWLNYSDGCIGARISLQGIVPEWLTSEELIIYNKYSRLLNLNLNFADETNRRR